MPKTKKKLPHNIDEKEFVEILHRIVKKLGYKFIFGYHSFEDMYQQAAIFAIEGLEKYDSSKPLENFLWTHLRNRLFNFKRDNFKRPDKPCLNCPLYDKDYAVSDNQCSKYSQVLDCSLYKKWYIRNSSKQNIMKPTSLENEKVVSSGAGSIFGDISNSELLNKIEKELRGEYREIYLKIKHGTKVNRADIKKLQKFIQENISECQKSADNYL
tara:strand:- start:12844 stop:13482 length:639 start_codon:yes stop_codon:yes gene_type:complete